MKTLLRAMFVTLIWIASALAATGAGAKGGSLLITIFLGFGALIIVCQLIPCFILFGAMIKGLFSRPKEAVAEEAVTEDTDTTS